MSTISKVLRSTMKAIRVTKFGGPEVLQLESNVAVSTPKETEILIKVSAIGVNPVDTYLRAGAYSRLPTLPYTPGSDTAGVVEQVGAAVKRFQKGDRVCTAQTLTGAYAEYTVADEKFVCHLHENLSFNQGAAIGAPYHTAYKALVIRGGAKAGETVLIHGASGGVGIACVQIAKANGLRVLGTAGSEEGLKLVKQIGADEVFNHREDGYTNKIMNATNGEGADVILEMLSNVNLQKDLNLVKFHGRIVVVGCRGTIEINPRLTMAKECTVTGIALLSSSEVEWKQMRCALEAGMSAGWVLPHVYKSYPLGDAGEAHKDIIETTSAQGKLLLIP